MKFLSAAVWLVLGCTIACSPGPVPISRSIHDPSNPSAAEGILPPFGSEAIDAGAATSVYACPMHPEITSSAPGRCPKCGMNLVPGK